MNNILNSTVDRFLDKCDDVLKHFPQDGQKQVSRYYETDCRHSHILNKLVKFTKNTKEFTSTDEQRMKKMLIESLDLADKKVNIAECLMDMVEKNMSNLETNYKEVEAAKLSLIKSNKRMSKSMPECKKIDSNSIDVLSIDNSNKRPKRNVTKISTTLNKSLEVNANLDKKPSTNQNKKNTALNKKSKAQPPKNKKVVSESESSDNESDNDLKPTYCICEEISYGDMVCCDNDLCPIEWFHFGCVSISRKPKGKWFCPFCRGTNSKTMKPKSVFLKELEEYNKRKEENW
ncbi:inhibitor of growth protein 2-like [Myzus persicae]|uniref:inhibitor of growth protein 2-like n=1 Tax=Myzus persicae TaxID=13164 RepID=UPI000B930EB2|nr:inhibitor of growth protein 2-like [Myzus persicae]XP_022177585.1 inhibitor of growth protein 2-like [Myzus persicae]XP_022177660.1 inhibitor of growth protein 2-like [Myzus persicae]XP_022177728.1 inhibitor of growth protein 2-like [Myzus persicae]